MHGGGSVYVGEDRRQPRTRLRSHVRRRELAAFAAIVLIIGVALPMAVDHLPTHGATQRALSALRVTWAMLFVSAGVLRLVRWRMTGEARNGYLGAALVCFGVVSAPSSLLAPAMFRTDPALTLSPLSRLVSVVICLLLVFRGLRAPAVASRLRPVRLTALVASGAWLALLVIVAVAAHHPLDQPRARLAAVEILLAWGWAAAAAIAVRNDGKAPRASTTWLSINLSTMALVELLRAVASVDLYPAAFFATGMQLVVAAISVANAGADLSEVFSADGNRLLSLAGALHETEELLSEEERDREERLHDARSVIAALKAASLTLDRYDERLDSSTKHRLRSTMVSELARLESVIDARAEQPLTEFRLDVALAPLFIAEKKNGLAINARLGMLSARGRPLEFVTVVQNLLVNARRYAPGSAVAVRASATDDIVTVYVEDRGPGIPEALREQVFARGYRAGAGSGEGSGLGLYLARRLIREQNGDIHVEERAGGGARFVLTLPRAAAPPVGRAAAAVPRKRTRSTDDAVVSRVLRPQRAES